MYWLFSLVVLVSSVIILFYTRKRKKNIPADYEQRIKQLENSFQELSAQAIESIDEATIDLAETIERANLTIQELQLEISKAERVIYQQRLAESKDIAKETVDRQIDELQKVVAQAEDFSSILAKEQLSEASVLKQPKYQKISELLDLAVSEREIAQQLNVGYAEIKLVKYLKKKT